MDNKIMDNKTRKNHNEYVNNIKSIIKTYEIDITEQKQKVYNIKDELIKTIARENIVITIKNQKLNDMSNGLTPVNIDYSITLTNELIDIYMMEIYNEIILLFEIQEKRKIVENNYRNECEYLKYLELSLNNKQQELAKYI
jgi:hypothetical protein